MYHLHHSEWENPLNQLKHLHEPVGEALTTAATATANAGSSAAKATGRAAAGAAHLTENAAKGVVAGGERLSSAVAAGVSNPPNLGQQISEGAGKFSTAVSKSTASAAKVTATAVGTTAEVSVSAIKTVAQTSGSAAKATIDAVSSLDAVLFEDAHTHLSIPNPFQRWGDLFSIIGARLERAVDKAICCTDRISPERMMRP